MIFVSLLLIYINPKPGNAYGLMKCQRRTHSTYNVCAVPWGSQYHGAVQYHGGVQYHGDILSTVGVFSAVGDIMINVGIS